MIVCIKFMVFYIFFKINFKLKSIYFKLKTLCTNNLFEFFLTKLIKIRKMSDNRRSW